MPTAPRCRTSTCSGTRSRGRCPSYRASLTPVQGRRKYPITPPQDGIHEKALQIDPSYGDADGTHPEAEREIGYWAVSALGLPSFDRLSALPVGLRKALELIPEIARNTALLRDVARALEQVAGDTDALPGIRKDMARVAEATSVLEAMDGRMAAIEEAMPVLVEVQRHLAQLPETMKQLLTALDELNQSVDTLQGAVEPMGRLANRVPGQRKKAQP